LPARPDWPWLAGAIMAGGVAGPVALMYGLTTTSASSASLLLNLEATFTALIAWFLFRENFDTRTRRLIRFPFVAPALGLRLPPDSQSPAIPLPFG
jgi:hypothetical protein